MVALSKSDLYDLSATPSSSEERESENNVLVICESDALIWIKCTHFLIVQCVRLQTPQLRA